MLAKKKDQKQLYRKLTSDLCFALKRLGFVILRPFQQNFVIFNKFSTKKKYTGFKSNDLDRVLRVKKTGQEAILNYIS